MSGLRIALTTPFPKLANELCEVVKLFFPLEAFLVNRPEADEGYQPLRHGFLREGNHCVCDFAFLGRERRGEVDLPQVEPERQELVDKRLIKRLSKVALYELLKAETGKRPPWGSLTGIRPTRLLYEKLAEGLPMEQATAALESVFDVTPEKTALLREIVTVQRTLPQPRPDQADLYVSVPFCRTRCAYCSFPGEAVGKGRQIAPYMEAVLWELGEARQLFDRAGLALRAVYVGGGTPTALNEDDFARLMDAVKAQFPGAAEYTVEAGRPDTITRAKLETLKRLGVGRISVNPQTMNDQTLRRIGRDHTAEQTVEAFQLARALGFSDINMDVIAGLPGEGMEEFRHTMAEISALKPDSMTVHTLAIKRSSRLNLERAPLPDPDVAAEMVRQGGETARALGMEPYYLYRQKYMAGQQQNVGYARPGAACLYNIGMMEETCSVVAVGAGAISKRVFPNRELRIERAPNVTSVAEYIDRVREMARRKEELFTNASVK